jgi:hypothetical protein
MQRFSDLAARHGAKFVVIFHPHPCQRFVGNYLSARRADLELVRTSNKNFAFAPESIFESWPKEAFSAYDHLRVGYEAKNSERVGRLLASSLGISSPAQDERQFSGKPLFPFDSSGAQSILGWATLSWSTNGVSATPCNRCDAADHAPAVPLEIIEGTGNGLHAAEMTLSDIEPGALYIISALVKSIGDRGLSINLLGANSPAEVGNVHCNMDRLEAMRGIGAVDAGLDFVSDGWSRCWVGLVLPSTHARLIIALLDKGEQQFYTGDGNAGVLLKDLTLQLARHR